MPTSLRHAMLRRAIRPPQRVSDNYEIKIVDTVEECEAAFRLLHEAYAELGYVKPCASRMRITRFHLLPTTTIVVAKFKGVVIGTISIMKDSPIGLPTDEILSLDFLRANGARIAEGSSLAVAPRHRNGQVMFLLMRYMYHYLSTHCGARYLVVTVNPRHEDFYAGLLLFKKFRRDVVKGYSFVNGADAVPMLLDLQTARTRYRETYSRRDSALSVYDFMVICDLPQLVFPPKEQRFANHGSFRSDWLAKFASNDSVRAFVSDPKAETLLRVCYTNPESSDLLSITDLILADVRLSEFWAINCYGMLFIGDAVRNVFVCRVYSAFDHYVELQIESQSQTYPHSATLSIGHGLTANVIFDCLLSNARVRYRVVALSTMWLAFVNSIRRRNVEGSSFSSDPLPNGFYFTRELKALQSRGHDANSTVAHGSDTNSRAA
ncbi:MAG: GNAT family N-acetyltransferase [Casimicrobium sp.]